MSKKHIEECIRESLEGYFKDLRGVEPDGDVRHDAARGREAAARRRDEARRRQPDQGGRLAGHQPQHAAHASCSTTSSSNDESATMRALHSSVSDKTGVARFRRGAARRWASRCCPPAAPPSCSPTPACRSPRSPTTPAFPEMLDGRVKTLHPKIHGGLLARRDVPAHMAGARRSTASTPIDLLVVNLYPFEATVAKPGCTLEDAIENIDIGGPAMVRIGGEELAGRRGADRRVAVRRRARRAEGRRQSAQATKFALSVAAFNRIAELRRRDQRLPVVAASARRQPRDAFPAQSNGRFVKLQDLRYGENPHQRAAFYRDLPPGAGLAGHRDAAAGQGTLVQQHRRRRRGLGVREELRRAGLRDRQAREPLRRGRRQRRSPRPMPRPSRPTRPRPSAASSRSTARSTSDGARIGRAQAVRRGADRAGLHDRSADDLRRQAECARAGDRAAAGRRQRLGNGPQRSDVKRVGSGLLIQTADNHERHARRAARSSREASRRPQQLDDLLFAWKVAKFVKSNAIVFCGGGMTLGVGAGQMSRIDSARIACIKAEQRQAVAAGLGGRERRLLPVPRRAGRGDRRRARPA